MRRICCRSIVGPSPSQGSTATRLLFRLFLSVLLLVLVVYTGVVIARHCADFVSVFFGDMARMGWAGQFNLDFMGMLLLSALWMAWRHRFSVVGIALALLAGTAGTPFLCIYLLVQSVRHRGDARALLLGDRLHDR